MENNIFDVCKNNDGSIIPAMANKNKSVSEALRTKYTGK